MQKGFLIEVSKLFMQIKNYLIFELAISFNLT